MTLGGSWLSGIREGPGTERLQVTRGQRDRQATWKPLPLSSPHSLPVDSLESSLSGHLKERI